MKKWITLLSVPIFWTIPQILMGQDAALDHSFDPGTSTNTAVEAIAVQNDGKILVAGHFNSKIIRLNANGSVDANFSMPSMWPAVVYDVAVLSNNKIMLVGEFNDYNGAPVSKIARLNADGTLDNSFNTGTGANDYISSIEVLSNGKMLIAGRFTDFNGVSCNGIARLNSDGTVDNTFSSGTGPGGLSGDIQNMVVHPGSGKILIAGLFTSYNGTNVWRTALLDENGAIDNGFTPFSVSAGSGGIYTVDAIAFQADGSFLVGGTFTAINGTPRNGIARILADGTIDASFDPGQGVQITWGTGVRSLHVMSNGKIMVGGAFNTFDGQSFKGIVRLNSDGTIDSGFDPGDGISHGAAAYGNIADFETQADGKILIGGYFDDYNGTERFNLARINGGDPIGQAELNAENISLYPNPVTHRVNLRFLPDHAFVQIFDAHGRLMYEKPAITGVHTISTHDYAPGLYTVRITSPEGTKTMRFVAVSH